MSQLLAGLRRRPGPLAGTFVALVLAALIVTVTASLIGTGLTLRVPARRLAGTAVVVTGNQDVRVTSGTGDSAQTDVLPLSAYRRLPASLAGRLAAVPGVAAAVPDISFPLALRVPGGRVVTGGSAAPVTGYGWASAALTPYALRAGHRPSGARQIAIGAGLARAAGLRPGDRVRLAGRDLPPFTVAGVAAAHGRYPARDQAVFFSDAQAAALYGHPGQADLIGVIARPHTSAARLAARVRGALLGLGRGERGLTVRWGADRGLAEDLSAPVGRQNLELLGTSAGLDIVMIALFVIASTVALSVAQRQRQFALLRAVGATGGQVRRMVMAELAALGVLAGLAVYLPGSWLASWVLRGLAAHQLAPPGTRAWTSPWILLIAVGTGVIVAELAGFIAARRASRVSPAVALQEASIERRWPHPVRTLLGLGALGGGVALCVVTLTQKVTADQQLNLALFTLLAFLAAVALLGPLLVAAAELLARLPLRLACGAAGRLALGDIRVRPRRMASAVIPVALAVTFLGAVYMIDAVQSHGSVVQGRQRLAASDVVTAPGPGLAPAALPAIAARPGVTEAVGLTPTTVFVPCPGGENVAAEAVTPGPLRSAGPGGRPPAIPRTVLDLPVVSGSLARFGPGDIALSNLITGKDAVNARVGQTITTYLADGTRYRAKVTAIYGRSLGFGDALVPAAAAGGGHLGTASLGEVLVRGSGGVGQQALAGRLAALAGRFPGLRAASRSVVNAQAQQLTAQSLYVNNMLLWLIALLAAVSLVNTLVMATVEGRQSLRLLRRIGATTRQLLSMTGWQMLVLGVTGITLGLAAAAAPVLVVSKVLTGTWNPHLTWPPVMVIVSLVLALTALSTMGPAGWMIAEDQPRA